MEEKANGIANWLSKHPLVQLPKGKVTPLKISLHTRTMDASRDAHLDLVESYLRTGSLPAELGMDD